MCAHDDGASSRMSITPIQRFKVSDSVAAQIKEIIERGDFAVGDLLPPERQLIEQFGVGRTSIREALRSLEAYGMVEIRHGVGAVVMATSANEQRMFLSLGDCTVPDLFEVRLALESKAASLAAQRITREEAEGLKKIMASMMDQTVNNEAYVELDAQLHAAIMQAAKNPLLAKLYASTQPLFVEYSMRMLTGLPGRLQHSKPEHARIVEAVLSGDSRQAEEAIQAHIRTVEGEVAAHLSATTLDAVNASKA